jgi:hypothetical protein
MVVLQETVTGHKLGMPRGIYMDGYLHANVEKIPFLLENNYDVVIMIFGMEGSGKTELAMQIGAATDHRFNVENVVFTAEQFKEAVEGLPKGSTIVWDESDETSGHHAKEKTRLLKRFGKRMRKENKCCIMVQPTILDMGRYWIMHRTSMGIRVVDKRWKTQPHKMRGYAEIYNKSRLGDLYVDAKRNQWDLSVGAPNKRIRFFQCTTREGFPVPIGEGSKYDKKKSRATEELTDEDGNKTLAAFSKKDIKTLYDFSMKSATQQEIANEMGIIARTLRRRLKKLEG